MNKEKVIETLKQAVEQEYEALKKAAQASYGDATHEENKPENKYDTRALEASYIAGAQAKRAQDVAELLIVSRILKLKKFTPDDPISIGALIEVCSDTKTHFLFFLPTGGGFSFTFEKIKIQVITPISPLGKAFVGHYVDDEVTIQAGASEAQQKIYQIVSVI